MTLDSAEKQAERDLPLLSQPFLKHLFREIKSVSVVGDKCYLLVFSHSCQKILSHWFVRILNSYLRK